MLDIWGPKLETLKRQAGRRMKSKTRIPWYKAGTPKLNKVVTKKVQIKRQNTNQEKHDENKPRQREREDGKRLGGTQQTRRRRQQGARRLCTQGWLTNNTQVNTRGQNFKMKRQIAEQLRAQNMTRISAACWMLPGRVRSDHFET